VARVLLDHGATAVEDDQGMTPFQVALDHEKHEIMKLLSEYGARSG